MKIRKSEADKGHTSISGNTSLLFDKGTCITSSDHEKIARMESSLEAIRENIDQAYNHICMDLPEINMEIYRTFQQAFDTLDSLSAHGSIGKIENVVEGIENLLQNLLLRIKHLKSYDTRILDALQLTSRHMEAARNLIAKGSSDQTIDPGFRTRMMKFEEKKDELIRTIKTILALEDDFITKIASCLGQDIRSLEYTLSSAVIILKDLITRSNSTKDPILKIMSGLQTHDIVNQDITTISLGLNKILTSTERINENPDDIMGLLMFQEKASKLSRDLIAQLMKVIRDHGSDLEKEIERIEDMVSQVKEDKEAIGGFLLMNQNGKSTFDIVIAEVTEMFNDLASRIEKLSKVKDFQQASTNRFPASYNDLEQYVTTYASSLLPPGMLDLVMKMISPLKSQAQMMRYGTGSSELKEKYKDFQKQSGIACLSLEEIKDLLIGSIKGIDTYSGRCMSAITKFRQDIGNLMMTLEGSENILEDLRCFSLSTAKIRGDLINASGGDHSETFTVELNDILYRLENPHSNSLASITVEDNNGGLTLF